MSEPQIQEYTSELPVKLTGKDVSAIRNRHYKYFPLARSMSDIWRIKLLMLQTTLITFNGTQRVNYHNYKRQPLSPIVCQMNAVTLHIFKIHFSIIFDSRFWSRDSVVGIVTGCRLDDRRMGIRVPVESKIVSYLRHRDRLWGHPASYPMGIGVSFPGGKAAGSWCWPLTSN
jgi:hypothetical protein